MEREASIRDLDFYVLECVCNLLSRRQKKKQPTVRISVNFSRKHLADKKFVNKFLHIVDNYHVPHEYLEVELTEVGNLNDYEIMKEVLQKLKQNGIRTSLDDFGTGYSSLNMLKNSDLDVIKIDRSFIPALDEKDSQKKDIFMLNSIIRIANGLGMEVVAEGVETREQLEQLKQLDCHIIQGFLFDAPLPEAEFEQKLMQGVYPLT